MLITHARRRSVSSIIAELGSRDQKTRARRTAKILNLIRCPHHPVIPQDNGKRGEGMEGPRAWLRKMGPPHPILAERGLVVDEDPAQEATEAFNKAIKHAKVR